MDTSIFLPPDVPSFHQLSNFPQICLLKRFPSQLLLLDIKIIHLYDSTIDAVYPGFLQLNVKEIMA